MRKVGKVENHVINVVLVQLSQVLGQLVGSFRSEPEDSDGELVVSQTRVDGVLSLDMTTLDLGAEAALCETLSALYIQNDFGPDLSAKLADSPGFVASLNGLPVDGDDPVSGFQSDLAPAWPGRDVTIRIPPGSHSTRAPRPPLGSAQTLE